LDGVVLLLSAFLAIYVISRFFISTGEQNRNSAFIFLLFMMLLMIATVAFNPWFKEKRSRLLLVLPVSIRRAALVRLAAELFYWLLLVISLLILCLFSADFSADKNLLLALCAQTGFILVIYSLAAFLIDIVLPVHPVSSFPRVEKIIRFLLRILLIVLGSVLLIIQLIGLAVLYEGKRDIYFYLFQTVPGAAVILFTGLVLVVLSLFLFEHRRSYVDY
jgi:hypothetical protein